MLDAAGEVDEAATAARRSEIRAERIGGAPEREPAPMEEYRAPLRVVEEGGARAFVCNHCEGPIAPITEDWKEHAVLRSWPLAERAAHLGTKVRPATARAMRMGEFSCRSCGTLLEVEVYEEGHRPTRDIRLGEVRTEPGEPF